MESPGHSDEEGPPPLDADGGWLPALVDYLLRRDRKRFDAYLAAARELIRGLQDFEIVTRHPARRQLDLIIENAFHLEGPQASSGVRLLLFFIALAYHPAPPRLILLEEPETAVHPGRLRDVMNLLRDVGQGMHGSRPAQVVLTTHSPYLLDHVNLDTDQVLVFERSEDGSCTAEPADRERLKVFLDEFLLGEVWFNQGEKGLVARK
jgi:predicted ATPase